MRVLALSPGSLEEQLDRLPALADICQKLNASLQVACDPQQAAPWKLLPCLEKLVPFSFEGQPHACGLGQPARLRARTRLSDLHQLR